MATINGYIVSDDSATVTIDFKPYTVHNDHPQWDNIVKNIKLKNAEAVLDSIRAESKINRSAEKSTGKYRVSVEHGVVKMNNEPVHGSLATRIAEMVREGFDVEPMCRFYENLMDNPSKQSIDELYMFLEQNSLPITDDGYFLAYKRVREDFTDVHSGKFDNSPGSEPSMERNEVDDRRNVTCSQGLHFCSADYLPSFSGSRCVILKINPADVVSIPEDYNNAKGRCCRYLVVDEWPDWQDAIAQNRNDADPTKVTAKPDNFKSVVTDYTPKAEEKLEQPAEQAAPRKINYASEAYVRGIVVGGNAVFKDGVDNEFPQNENSFQAGYNDAYAFAKMIEFANWDPSMEDRAFYLIERYAETSKKAWYQDSDVTDQLETVTAATPFWSSPSTLAQIFANWVISMDNGGLNWSSAQSVRELFEDFVKLAIRESENVDVLGKVSKPSTATTPRQRDSKGRFVKQGSKSATSVQSKSLPKRDSKGRFIRRR